MRRVLIVGATGILRPAVLACVARGWNVTAVARNPTELARLVDEAGPLVIAAPMDVFDPQAPAESLDSDDALLYLAAGDDSTENLAADRLQTRVTGTVVRILTSRWWPNDGSADGPWPTPERRLHLLLGQHRDPATGEVRWHTPPEVSAAALSVLDNGSDAVLGTPVI